MYIGCEAPDRRSGCVAPALEPLRRTADHGHGEAPAHNHAAHHHNGFTYTEGDAEEATEDN